MIVLLLAGCAGDKETTLPPEEDVMSDDAAGSLPAEDVAASADAQADGKDEAPDVTGGTPEEDVEEVVVVPGTISGRIVNAQGEGLVGIKMLSCTTSLCVSGETGANGEYLFEGIDPEPQKMQATDAGGVYMSVIFYQECISEEHEKLSWDVVMPERNTAVVSWPEGQAGELVTADGALTLTLADGALDYPLGFFDENIRVEYVPGSQLPPYDAHPWAGAEEGVFAYYFYPLHIMAEPFAAFSAVMQEPAPEGAEYEIWSVDPDSARIELVGKAVVDVDGALVSATDAELKHLSTLILVPAQ